uniref:membrane-spanning 4-domains subfamily A member 12-like n=1 Tax=Pristiophorus japonicus TaxID=55135 RepID=UPI00398E5071
MASKGLSGHLSSLGVTQIMLGLIQLTFGIPLFFIARHAHGSAFATPFWTGIWYIISGAVSTEIKDLSNNFKVKLVFAANAFSAVVAGIGIIEYSRNLCYPGSYYATWRPAAPFTLPAILQYYTVVELIMAIGCAILIGSHLFRCCNINSVSPA